MTDITYIEAIRQALWEEMERDERVFLIGEDIGHYGGLFRVTRKLMDEFGLTQEQVAERVGRSRVTVANSLRLLHLADEIKSALLANRISEGSQKSHEF